MRFAGDRGATPGPESATLARRALAPVYEAPLLAAWLFAGSLPFAVIVHEAGSIAVRYRFALAGALLLGAGFLWALIDREGLFLHDRLAGTKIIKEEG